MSKLLSLCKEIIEFATNGDPIKDVIEGSDYRNDELLVELASHYVAAHTGGQVRRERADL